MDDSCIPQTVMEGCCRGRRPVAKPRGKKESAVWSDVTDLLQTLKWKVWRRLQEGDMGRPQHQNRSKYHRRRALHF